MYINYVLLRKYTFLVQRNCHRNIYNQFSRGLPLHCSWQQNQYHGGGKSEAIGQDNAGTGWLNGYLTIIVLFLNNFLELHCSQIQYSLSVSWHFSWECSYSEIWYPVFGILGRLQLHSLQCLWLTSKQFWSSPAESSLAGLLQTYLGKTMFLSHVCNGTTWFCLAKHRPLEWRILGWCTFVNPCRVNVKGVSVQNFPFPKCQLFLLVALSTKAVEVSALG